MTTEFSRHLLRVALAQICQNLGWTSVHSTPMELLTDVLERYITGMGVYAHRYSEQFGRVEPTLDDLGLAFQEMGVNLTEVSDFLKHVDPVPFAFEVPRYPVPRPNLLNFPKPNSRELHEREEHVHDHMPTMHQGWDEEIMAQEGDEADASGVDAAQAGSAGGAHAHGEKRAGAALTDQEPDSKRARRVYPDEALPSGYEMRGVSMSDRGLPVGQGKLPEPIAPPPPTPTTPMLKNPLANLPSFIQKIPEDDLNSPEPLDVEEVAGVITETVKEETNTEPIAEQLQKSPRGRPPKSPKVDSPQTPKTSVSTPEVKKKRGRPFKFPPKTPGAKPPESPISKLSKSPGRPPKSPVGRPPKKSPGRPPKSPLGRPPKSPLQSPTRSPGRPPKSPGRVGSPRSPGRSPVRSPLSSPLSPAGGGGSMLSAGGGGRGKSPGKSPGRPPKSPGRAPGRPPKSPGRPPGRPPKSPGRPPVGKKGESGSRPPQSPIREYLLTGELPVGEKGVPTKAELKMKPMQSPPRGRKPSAKTPKRSDSIQKLDFEKEPPAPSSVISETIEVNTYTEKAPSKSSTDLSSPKSDRSEKHHLKKPTASIDETIQAVLSSAFDDADDDSVTMETVAIESSPSKRQREREEQLRQEILNKDRERQKEKEKAAEKEKMEIESESAKSGRVTPDWIKQEAERMRKEVQQKEKEERKAKVDERRHSPSPVRIKEEFVASPKLEKDRERDKDRSREREKEKGEKVKDKEKVRDKDKDKEKVRDKDKDKDKVKVKKEKKKKRDKDKHREEHHHDRSAKDLLSTEEKKAEKKSKKERKLEKLEEKLREKLREKVRDTSPSSSSPERHLPSDTNEGGGASVSIKQEVTTSVKQEMTSSIQPLRIGIGNKSFTIKPMAEESDKEKKKKKKEKKKKEKERDREGEREEKKEKSKKDKKKDKEKKKEKKEAKAESLAVESESEPSLLPKLKFKLGGKGMTVTPTQSPHASPKRKAEIPKLVIKHREESPEKRVFTRVDTPSRGSSTSRSPSPRRRTPSPPRRRTPSPAPPPSKQQPLHLSPVRFTPSPESNPATPSMNSPFHQPSTYSPSPTYRRSSFEYKPPSSRERSLSPVKTPSYSRASASPLTADRLRQRSLSIDDRRSSADRRSYSRSPSPAPPAKPSGSDLDEIPPMPPSSSSKGKKGKAAAAAATATVTTATVTTATVINETKVIAETQGTIIGENGEIIWICPACALADDGSPMIGCDVCDDWYHWACMGITEEPPDDESWFCPKHRSREPPKKSTPGRGRGRGRGRKKKA